MNDSGARSPPLQLIPRAQTEGILTPPESAPRLRFASVGMTWTTCSSR